MVNETDDGNNAGFVEKIAGTVSSIATRLSNGIMDKILNPPGSAGYITKKNAKLKRRWDNADNNLKNAPFELSLAEKNYYDYNKGEDGGNAKYNLMIFDRFATNAAELQQNSIEKQQEFMADLTQSLKQYQGQKLFAERTLQLLNVREEENADLLNKIDMYNRIMQTNERKVVYEIRDTTSQYTYRRVMLYLYYAAIICYIVFSNFIPDKLYINKTIWLVIVIACLIPIILNLIIKWVFIIADVLAYWFNTRPYKDMYADLKGSHKLDMNPPMRKNAVRSPSPPDITTAK